MSFLSLPASFYGDSSISMPFDDPSPTVNLELRFLTSRPNGLLFRAEGQTDFLSLHLASGILELQGDFGSGNWTHSTDQSTHLDDQSWHYVVITQTGKDMTVSVDGSTSNFVLPGTMFQLNKDEIFIGGKRSSDSSTRSWEHFRGCISNILFNRYDILNRVQQLRSSDLVHHVSWNCDSIFSASSSEAITIKGGDSYLAFPHLNISTNGFVAFDFKTLSQTTFLILSLAKNLSYSDLLAIELINGMVKLTTNRGGSDIIIRSEIVTNDNQWHSVRVVFEKTRAILQVDSERKQAAFDQKSNDLYQITGNFFIGGLTKDIKNLVTNQNMVVAMQHQRNFQGCIRNLEVNSEALGFKEIDISRDIEKGCTVSVTEVAPEQDDRDSIDETSGRAGQQIVRVVPLRVDEGNQSFITKNTIHVVFKYKTYGIRESAIQFKITEPPKHGYMDVGGRSSDAFSLLDLIIQRVSYVHDGSETTSDDVAMEMIIVSSSRAVPEKLTQKYAFVLPIIVSPTDDPPVIKTLNGSSQDATIKMAKNSKLKIRKEILAVEDQDTTPARSVFTPSCINSRGSLGHFERMDVPNEAVKMFTFQEIIEGLIWFSAGSKETVCTVHILKSSVKLTFLPIKMEITLTKSSGLRLVQGSYSLLLPENLTVTTNLPYQENIIQYEITRSPRFGEIQKKTSEVWSLTSRFTQEDIRKGRIRYIHKVMADNAYFDQFAFIVKCLKETLDQHSFFIQTERLTLKVNTSASIKITQKDYKILSSADLLAETNDKMMPKNQIRFVIIRAPAIGSIYRVHKMSPDLDLLSDLQPLQPDEHFTQDDINNGYVIYRLTQLKNKRRIDDYADLKVVAGSTQHVQAKMIRIHFEYNPPVTNVQFTNNGLTSVIEGGLGIIERSDLYLETKDYSEFEFDIMDFPMHGILQIFSQNVSKFTNEDIRNTRLVYAHDGSENDKDRFTFIASPILRTTDSLPIKVQEFTGTFQIKILMQNDNAPTRLVDKVFHVVVGQERVITLDDLAFTDPDIDYDPMNLAYRFGSPIRNGEIINNVNNKAVTDFHQRDIADGHISFRHRGDLYEKIMCLVNDGQFFTRFIFEIEAAQPYVKILKNTGVGVQDSESVAISSFNLSVETNVNVNANNIRFVLIEQPLYGNLEVNRRPVTQFTLQTIMDGTLLYRHHGKGRAEDAFKFAAVAGRARVQDSFNIQIVQSSQNYPPRVIHNTILEVPELGEATFKKENLQVMHPDSQPENVTYTVKVLPKHGRLQLTGKRRQNERVDFTFTQEDINAGRLKYHHSDFTPTADSFVFDVTNGIQTLKGLQFAIEIIPARLELEIQNFTIQEGTRKALTRNNIRLKSRYYDGKTITFSVVRPPRHGWVERASRRNKRVYSFTFAELIQGRIYYVHDNR